MITVEGSKYTVTEDLGWQDGIRAKAVNIPRARLARGLQSRAAAFGYGISH